MTTYRRTCMCGLCHCYLCVLFVVSRYYIRVDFFPLYFPPASVCGLCLCQGESEGYFHSQTVYCFTYCFPRMASSHLQVLQGEEFVQHIVYITYGYFIMIM